VAKFAALGGKWPEAARKIAGDAYRSKEDDSQNIRLLADIRDVIETNKKDKHTSSERLVSALVAMSDKGWNECNHGKPLTQNGLARKLLSGYSRKQFGLGEPIGNPIEIPVKILPLYVEGLAEEPLLLFAG
jgi:hypothetical protein